MKVEIIYDGNVYDSFRDIKVVQGSEGYVVEFSVKTDSGSVVDLSGFSEAKLELKDVVDSEKKEVDLVIDTNNNVLKWEVSGSDTDTEGIYATELTLSDGSGKVYKFQIGLLTIIKEL